MDPILIGIGLVALTVTSGFGYGLWRLASPTRTASDRLQDLAEGETNEVVELVRGSTTSINPMVERLSKLASPASDEDRNYLKQLLFQAGYRGNHAVDIFNATRVTSAVCLPLVLGPLLSSSLSSGAFWALIGATSGYFVPYLLVKNKVDTRQATLLKQFPDALDLLVSSVEAGLGLDAAFRRVSSEIESSAPELAREFQGVNYEIGAGVPRSTALKHLYERTGVDEIRSLVNMLVQSERFGSSVAKSLRIHSKAVREKRMSRAEATAAQVSPKLTVVMILFLLPVLFGVLMGPAMIMTYDVFVGQ